MMHTLTGNDATTLTLNVRQQYVAREVYHQLRDGA